MRFLNAVVQLLGRDRASWIPRSMIVLADNIYKYRLVELPVQLSLEPPHGRSVLHCSARAGGHFLVQPMGVRRPLSTAASMGRSRFRG